MIQIGFGSEIITSNKVNKRQNMKLSKKTGPHFQSGVLPVKFIKKA